MSCEYIFFLWRNSPTRARATSSFTLLDHTQWHTTVVRTPLDEGSARRSDLYLTTDNTHKRQTPMHPAGFEPAVRTSERPKTPYAAWPLGSAVTIIQDRLWYGAESFLTSQHVLSYSTSSPYLMKPEGSSPYSQEPVTCPYPASGRSSSCPNPTFLYPF